MSINQRNYEILITTAIENKSVVQLNRHETEVTSRNSFTHSRS
jgi:hypothetical protein